MKGPRDLEGARKAIMGLVDDPAKWKKMSANATERATTFARSNLIVNLDGAINKELERESGLSSLSPEVRSTLTEPELVVKAWSHGTLKVLATDKRLFVQQGKFSRSTIEAPFSSIHSIEHVRHYHWKTLATGVFLSAMLFTQRFLYPIVSRAIITAFDELILSIVPSAGALFSEIVLLGILFPLLAALGAFAFGARKGYALHGATLKPIFLPQSFGDTIRYIRDRQDRAHEGSPEKATEESETKPSEDQKQVEAAS